MSTTVDYLLLRHSESIYFEPNAIPQVADETSKNIFSMVKKMIGFFGHLFSGFISLNLQPQTPKALSKSPYAQIAVKGIY